MEKQMTKNLAFISCLGFIVAAILLCLPFVQNELLSFGGRMIGRTLKSPEVWIGKMFRVSLLFIVFANLIFTVWQTQGRINKSLEKISLFLWLFILAFFTSSLFSLFPLKLPWTGTDSSVFIYIGQEMHKGKIPYKDMFDHKGLYLYFLEFLGVAFNNHRGIYVIELVSIFITILFLFRTSGFITENKYVKFFTVFVVVYFYGREVYEGGNLTEEYALPCIAYSNYIFLKYLFTKECRHKDFIFVGISFTLVLFFRANMVALWAFYVVYFFVTLLRERLYGALRKMVVGFSSGVIIASIPAFVYFLMTGSFIDMWDSYILFNFKYISDEGGVISNLSVAAMFVNLFFMPCMCFFAEILQKGQERCHRVNFFAFLVNMFFVAISGRGYHHYGIILLPFFVLPIAYVLDVLRNNAFQFSVGRTLHFATLSSRGLMILMLLIPVVRMPIEVGSQNTTELVNFLKRETRYDADVLVLGNDVLINIESERFSKQRFFYQLPVVMQNPLLMQEFLGSLTANPPDYIVVPRGRKDMLNKDSVFSPFLGNFIEGAYNIREFDTGYIYIRRL